MKLRIVLGVFLALLTFNVEIGVQAQEPNADDDDAIVIPCGDDLTFYGRAPSSKWGRYEKKFPLGTFGIDEGGVSLFPEATEEGSDPIETTKSAVIELLSDLKEQSAELSYGGWIKLLFYTKAILRLAYLKAGLVLPAKSSKGKSLRIHHNRFNWRKVSCEEGCYPSTVASIHHVSIEIYNSTDDDGAEAEYLLLEARVKTEVACLEKDEVEEK